MKKIECSLFQMVHLSAFEASFEMKSDTPFFTNYEYDVYLNDDLVLKKQNTNVFSLFNLEPSSDYIVKVKACDKCDAIYIKTLTPSNVYNVLDYGIDNSGNSICTKHIQELIYKADSDSVIYFPKGIYLVTPIFVKSNISFYLEKDAILLGDINRNNYPIIPAILEEDGVRRVGGSWEGVSADNYASIISAMNVRNFELIGEGIIDGNAQNSDWWINHKEKRGAWRPHIIFTNRSTNLNFVGITVKNSPSWTIHPYYSDHLQFINIKIEELKNSPNTDGIDPESCNNVLILGVKFNTGDDCIAIKSGKIDMTEEFYKPSTDITIRNCFMGDGHGGVVFGSESSCGIKGVYVSKCIFEGTDRGFRIKTRRGRGNKAVVEDVHFNNILMNKVKSALVINMYYYCDADGKTDYVQSKKMAKVDNMTPHLGVFTFENMQFLNTHICAGYFYGLPEAKIEEINLKNIKVTYPACEVRADYPAMMNDCELISKGGFYFRNVKRVNIDNVDIEGQNGEKYNY